MTLVERIKSFSVVLPILEALNIGLILVWFGIVPLGLTPLVYLGALAVGLLVFLVQLANGIFYNFKPVVLNAHFQWRTVNLALFLVLLVMVGWTVPALMILSGQAGRTLILFNRQRKQAV